MMPVEDWASEEARGFVPNLVGQFGFKSGIVHAFSALLSDEAVEAAADKISDATEPGNWSMVARAATTC